MLQFSTIHVGHTVMEIVVIKVRVTHVFFDFHLFLLVTLVMESGFGEYTL